MPTSGLLEALPGLLTTDRPATLGAVLRELRRRGDRRLGLAGPAALLAGDRVKA